MGRELMLGKRPQWLNLTDVAPKHHGSESGVYSWWNEASGHGGHSPLPKPPRPSVQVATLNYSDLLV